MPTPLALVLVGAALAGRNDDPCAAIKPAQQLETEKQQAVDGALKVGIAGLGRGEGQVSTELDAKYDTRLLSEDDLARSWTVYQLCVMRRDGVITASLQDELMRELFGVAQPTASAPAPGAPPAPTPGSATGCPWRAVDMADASKSGVVVNGQLWPIDTQDQRAAFRDVLNACSKGDAARWFLDWTTKLDQQQDKNVLGQPSRDAQKAVLLAGRSKKKMLKALAD